MKQLDPMIGKRIKERRLELHITQTEISQKTSISSGNLSSIENAKYMPSAQAIVELSQILDCTTDWLLTGKSSKSNTAAFSDNEESELLRCFRLLGAEDREELIEIATMKVARKRKRDAESSASLNAVGVDATA